MTLAEASRQPAARRPVPPVRALKVHPEGDVDGHLQWAVSMFSKQGTMGPFLPVLLLALLRPSAACTDCAPSHPLAKVPVDTHAHNWFSARRQVQSLDIKWRHFDVNESLTLWVQIVQISNKAWLIAYSKMYARFILSGSLLQPNSSWKMQTHSPNDTQLGDNWLQNIYQYMSFFIGLVICSNFCQLLFVPSLL